MNSRKLALVLLGCLLVSFVTYTFTASATPQAESRKAAVRWEHLALTHDSTEFDAAVSSQINRLGNEGWELVSVSTVADNGTTTKTVFYFKRPK